MLTPILLAAADDREVWLEQRRGGITATEVAKAATGRPAERRKVLAEKVTGTPLLSNRYIDWGNAREPFLADWIDRNYGIAPNRHLLARPGNPRYLATPDGYSVLFVDDQVAVAEIKTSRHDLNPLDDDAEENILTPKDGDRGMSRGTSYFWAKTVYYDQMQWQMFVTGASACLFVWEQHDDDWPNPKPFEPRAVWVERNDKRIETLVEIADGLLADIDAARPGTLPWDQGDIPLEIVDAVHRVLEARNQEAIAKKSKEAAWAEVMTYLKALKTTEDYLVENTEAKVTWTALPVTVEDYDLSEATDAQRRTWENTLRTVDRVGERVAKAEAALKKAKAAHNDAVDRMNERGARWRVTTVVSTNHRLSITAKKSAVER